MPWKLHQNYILDRLMLRRSKLEDGALDFSKSLAKKRREGKPCSTATAGPKPWKEMRQSGAETPHGITPLKDSDDWAVPVIFGVGAVSKAAAVAFAIDHNNLGMLGGHLGFTDLIAIWDEPGLQKILTDMPDAEDLLASFDGEDVAALLGGPDFALVDSAALCDGTPLCGNRGKPRTAQSPPRLIRRPPGHADVTTTSRYDHRGEQAKRTLQSLDLPTVA